MKQLNIDALVIVNALDESGKAFKYDMTAREESLTKARQEVMEANKACKADGLKAIGTIDNFINLPGYDGYTVKAFTDEANGLTMYKVDERFYRTSINAWYKARKEADSKEPFVWRDFDVTYCKLIHQALKRVKTDSLTTKLTEADSKAKDGKKIVNPISNASLVKLFQAVCDSLKLDFKVNRSHVRTLLYGLTVYKTASRELTMQSLTTIERLFIDVLNGMKVSDGKAVDSLLKREAKRKEADKKEEEKSLKKAEAEAGKK